MDEEDEEEDDSNLLPEAEENDGEDLAEEEIDDAPEELVHDALQDAIWRESSLGMPILRWRAFCACMPMLAASTNTRSNKRNRRYVNAFVFNVYLVFWFL